MANLSKIKRDRMIEFLEQLKKQHSDDASIRAFNEIENQLRDKKYGLVWEEHSEQVDDTLKENIPVLVADTERRLCKDKTLPWNFIIEGDNLQALYLLEKTHKGKIDCIYIDPPYNTGARDWKYNNDYVDGNDVYRHSKWLSMMKSRLIIAKELLNKDNSILICTIDDKEYLHLGCLLEELFTNSKITMISSVINPAGKAKKGGVDFSRTDEYIFFVQIGRCAVLPETRETTKSPIAWENFRRHSLANGRGKHGIGACGPNQFYPFYIDNKTHEIVKIGLPLKEGVSRFSVEQIDGCSTVFPVRDNGIEMNWGGIREHAIKLYKRGYLRVGKFDPAKPQQFAIQYLPKGTISAIEDGTVVVTNKEGDKFIDGYFPVGKPKVPTTNWNKQSHNATSHGTDLLTNLFHDARFDYPKSLYAVRDCMKLFIEKNKHAIILDFFAGSGTTGHAVNLLNAEDDGKRTWIMVTNNEISEAEAKEFEQQGIKKGDKKWEDKGIAKYVTWPRTVCSINGVDVNGNQLKGNYLDSDIPMSDGFNANVKYLKCEWTPRKPQDYLLSNALGLHIKEMIELQYAIEIDNIKNVLILNKDDFKNIFGNKKVCDQIENIWINQNIVFNAAELKILKSKKYKYIPKEFFGQELREAAE